jgi:hypothetical protein
MPSQATIQEYRERNPKQTRPAARHHIRAGKGSVNLGGSSVKYRSTFAARFICRPLDGRVHQHIRSRQR